MVAQPETANAAQKGSKAMKMTCGFLPGEDASVVKTNFSVVQLSSLFADQPCRLLCNDAVSFAGDRRWIDSLNSQSNLPIKTFDASKTKLVSQNLLRK